MFFEDIWSILSLKIDQMSKVCDRYCRQILSKHYSRLNDRFCIYKKNRWEIFLLDTKYGSVLTLHTFETKSITLEP